MSSKKDDLKISKVTMIFKKNKKQKNIKELFNEIDEIQKKLSNAEHEGKEKEWFELVDKLSEATGLSRDKTIFKVVFMKHLAIDGLGTALEELKEKEQDND